MRDTLDIRGRTRVSNFDIEEFKMKYDAQTQRENAVR